MKKHTRYLIILATILISWLLVISRPLRIIAGMVHDFGHSLGALIVGKGIDSFSGAFAHGELLTAGSSTSWFQIAFIIIAAILTSLGAACLFIAASTGRIKKYIAGSAAIIILIMTYNYSTDFNMALYSMIYACLVLLFFMINKDFLFKWLMEILGFAMLAFIIFDSLVNIIIYELNNLMHFTANWPKPYSDCSVLAAATNIPSIVWAVLWLALTAMVFLGLARMKGARTRKGRNEST